MQRSNSMKKLAKLVNDDDFADDFGDVEWTSSFQRPTSRRSSRSVQAAAKPVTQDDLAAKAPRPRKSVARTASLSLPKKSAPPLLPMPLIAQQTEKKPSVRVGAKPVSAPAPRTTPISAPAPAPPALAPAPPPPSVDTTISSPPGPTIRPIHQSTHDPTFSPQPSQAQAQALDDFGEFAETAVADDEFDDFAAASASSVAPGHVDDDFGDFATPVLATPRNDSSIEQSLAAESSMCNGVEAKTDSFHSVYEPATSHVTSAAVHEALLTSTSIHLDDPVAQDDDDALQHSRLGKGEADPGWVDSGGGGSGNTEFGDVGKPAGDANGFGDFAGNEPGTVDEEASLEDEFSNFGTQILSKSEGTRRDYFEEGWVSRELDITPTMEPEPSIVSEAGTAGNMSSDSGIPAENQNVTLTRESQQDLLDNSKPIIANDDDAFGDFGTPTTAVNGRAPDELETTAESVVNWNRDNELGDFATLAPSIDTEELNGFGPIVGSTANRTLDEFDEFDTPAVSAAGDLSGDFSMPARVTSTDGFEAAAVEKRVRREEAGKNDFDNFAPVTPIGGEAGKHAPDDDFGLATLTGGTDDEFNNARPPIAFATGKIADDDDDGFGDFGAPVVGTDGFDEVEGSNPDGLDEFDGFRPSAEKTEDWIDEVRTPDCVREHGDEKANDEFGEFGDLGRAADEDDGFGDFGGPAKRGDESEDEFGGFTDPGNSHNEDEDEFGDFGVPAREVEKDKDGFNNFGISAHVRENAEDEFGNFTREDDGFKFSTTRGGYNRDDDEYDDGWDDEPKPVATKKAQRAPPPPIATVPKAKVEVPLVALEEVLLPNMDWSDKASLITAWARLLNGIYPTMKPPPGSMSSAGSSDAPSSIKDLVLNAHESLHAKLTWTAVTRSMDMDDGVPKVVWKGSQIETLHLTALGYKRGVADASVSLSLPPLEEDSTSGIASPDLFSPVDSPQDSISAGKPDLFSPIDSPRDSFQIYQPSSPYTSPSTTTPVERSPLHKKTTSISSIGRAFSTFTQMITPSSPVHEKSLTNASSPSLASSSSSPPSSTHRSGSLDSLGPGLVFPVSEQSDSPPAVSSPASHPQSVRAVVSGKTTNGRTTNKASVGEFPFFVDQEDPVVSPPLMQSPPPQSAGDTWLSTNDVSFLAEFATFAVPTASTERSSVLDDDFEFGDLTTPPLALPKVASILPVVTAAKLAPELQMLVDRLPDLNYMRSGVIIFPVGGAPLMGADRDKAGAVGLGIVEESGREEEDEWGGWAG